MIIKKENQKLVFSGNIVEIQKCKNEFCAKILFRPGYMKIKIDEIQDLHLGDELEVECDVKVLKTISDLGKFNFDLI